MSSKIIATVLEGDLHRQQKLVLIYFADAANSDGDGVALSIAYLAAMTGYSRRAVSRIIRSLVEDRLLIDQGATPGGKRIFRLNARAIRPVVPAPDGDDLDAYARGFMHEVTPDPIKEQEVAAEPPSIRAISGVEVEEHVFALIGFFSSLTAIFPPHVPDTVRGAWCEPLRAIRDQCDSQEDAEAVIAESVAMMASKGYTVASPKSIRVTANNIILRRKNPAQPDRRSAVRNILDAMERYGRRGWTQARASLSAEELELLNAVGGWEHAHGRSLAEVRRQLEAVA